MSIFVAFKTELLCSPEFQVVSTCSASAVERAFTPSIIPLNSSAANESLEGIFGPGVNGMYAPAQVDVINSLP